MSTDLLASMPTEFECFVFAVRHMKYIGLGGTRKCFDIKEDGYIADSNFFRLLFDIKDCEQSGNTFITVTIFNGKEIESGNNDESVRLRVYEFTLFPPEVLNI